MRLCQLCFAIFAAVLLIAPNAGAVDVCFSDSGTASFELKTNVLLFYLLLLLLFAWLWFPGIIPPAGMLLLLSINLLINSRLLSLFFKTGGLVFAVLAGLYYLLAYPLAVGSGALVGLLGQRNLQLKTMLRA